jgi:hypothetical protein
MQVTGITGINVRQLWNYEVKESVKSRAESSVRRACGDWEEQEECVASTNMKRGHSDEKKA